MRNRTGSKIQEGKEMLWAFTQNNALEILKELESIEGVGYELHIKEKDGPGLIIILEKEEKKLEVDTDTLKLTYNNIPSHTINKVKPVVVSRLRKTNNMLRKIGRLSGNFN